MPQKAVRHALDQPGEPLRPSCPVSGVYRRAILDQHGDGKSIKEISPELGLNFAAVYRVPRRAGRIEKKHR